MILTSVWQPCKIDTFPNRIESLDSFPFLLEGFGEIDMCGIVMSVASIPLAGGAGVMQALFPVRFALLSSFAVP